MNQAQLEEWVIESIESDMDAVLDRLVHELNAAGLLTPLTEARLVDSLRQAATAELHAGMRGWTLDRRLPEAPPAESGEFARRAARAGLPLTVVMRVYMVALNVYWEAIFDAILAGGATDDVRNDLVRAGTRYFQRFMTQISTLAAEEHADERDRAVRRRALRRLATVQTSSAAGRRRPRCSAMTCDGRTWAWSRPVPGPRRPSPGWRPRRAWRASSCWPTTCSGPGSAHPPTGWRR